MIYRHIPNALTWFRILSIPLIVLVFYLPYLPVEMQNIYATALFLLAAVTDWLDGFLARRLGVSSHFGAFLDPVADKLFVTTTLILLVHLGRAEAWVAIVITGREITMSALREWMASLGKNRHIAVSWLGKVKTVAQLFAIPLLLIGDTILGASVFGTYLLYLAAVLTLLSMFYYLKVAWPHL